MIGPFNQVGAVTARVVSQLRRDHRLIGLSLVFPVLIIYFFKVLVDALANPMFNPSIYIVPYGAFLVHFITLLLSTIVLIRERTEGTLDRMFISGYNQMGIISGYLLGYTFLVTLQSFLILFELNWLFELDYGIDQLASIYLVMWLLSVISMILGILISNFCRNVAQALPFIPLVLISVIVSGIIVPLDILPEWVQAISYVTPLFYANEVIQELIRGGTLLDEWKMLIGLPIYGMVLLALATLTLRELD